MMKMIFAIPAALAAIPKKPKSAAISAMMKNAIAQANITASCLYDLQECSRGARRGRTPARARAPGERRGCARNDRHACLRITSWLSTCSTPWMLAAMSSMRTRVAGPGTVPSRDHLRSIDLDLDVGQIDRVVGEERMLHAVQEVTLGAARGVRAVLGRRPEPMAAHLLFLAARTERAIRVRDGRPKDIVVARRRPARP